MNTILYTRFQKLRITISHVCEVGVYTPESSNVLEFIKAGIRTTLVEVDPVTVDKIQRYFTGYANVKIYPVAVADQNAMVTFYRKGSSTFAADLPFSPALINDRYARHQEDTFVAPAQPFNELDDGTIDLLSIDIEGGEWFVLKHLKSRPKVISIETHGKCYKNPYYAQIIAWMRENGYEIWYLDRSDTVFAKKELLSLNLFRKTILAIDKFLVIIFRMFNRIRYVFTRR
jgi:FkbM family methyltransferase